MGKTSMIDGARALALWQTERPLANIARELGVHRMALSSYAQRRGWPIRVAAAGRRQHTWDDVAARALWNEGYTLRVIAERVGITPQTLRSYASYHRWPQRGEIVRGPVAPPQADLAPIVREDDDIARYRAEKLRKVARDEMQLADARRLFKLLERAYQPKRGRPRKTQDKAA